MQTQRERLALLDRMITAGVDRGLGHRIAEDAQNDGRHVRLDGRQLLNFASCSYLGLELDSRLIEAAIDAVRSHGIQMCSSRVYVSSPLYAEFEALVEQIFGASVIVAPTTTLGHLAALPVLVDEEDAIVMDHQVHTSVQLACTLLRSSGTHLEFTPHNDMERLEDRVADLSKRYRQVWYMADGVYSMFGDFAPNEEIVAMLDRQPQMRYYVDDAHGMSWCGPRGVGSVLNEISLHPRMILTTGLGKGFGTGGGLIVLPETEQKRRIRTCGPTMLFCGPLQPPVLGAAIASARIHLSDEIYVLQAELQTRMALCNARFAEHALPMISSPETPVGFVGMGPGPASQNLCGRLLEEGFYTNPATFPATPVRRTGGRFLLTRHHEPEDIEALVSAVAKHWEPAIREAGSTPEAAWEAFGLDPPVARQERRARTDQSGLHLESVESIDKLDRDAWDSMLGDRGCLGSRAMALYERVFGQDIQPENHWQFRYYVVRDHDGRPVLATCFTSALWKADMLSAAEISEQVEKRRIAEPGYLTQRVFAMGCLLSEGDHLWLRESADSRTSRDAIHMLLDAVRTDADELGCSVRVVRDIPDVSTDVIALLEEEGLFRMQAPDSLVLRDVYASDDELIARLGRKHRYHQERYVQPFNACYRVDVVGLEGRALEEGEEDLLYALYSNVKDRNLDLNTFPLPRNILSSIACAPGWEILVFRSADAESMCPVGFLACYLQGEAYVPLFAGLQYDLVESKGLYRQLLRHAALRAHQLGLRRVLYGVGASLEKRRFGARPESASMFIEADDHYAFDALAQITSNTV